MKKILLLLSIFLFSIIIAVLSKPTLSYNSENDDMLNVLNKNYTTVGNFYVAYNNTIRGWFGISEKNLNESYAFIGYPSSSNWKGSSEKVKFYYHIVKFGSILPYIFLILFIVSLTQKIKLILKSKK